jgi:hypothetical protein
LAIKLCDNVSNIVFISLTSAILKRRNNTVGIYVYIYTKVKVKQSPGLEWPRGFQEVKVPRLHENGTGLW